MSDNAAEPNGDKPRELNPGVYQGDDGLFYSRRTGRQVFGGAIYKKTPEELEAWQNMVHQRQREKREELERRIAAGEVPPKRPTNKWVRERALADLKPTAVKVLEEILTSRHGVECPECGFIIEKLSASLAQVVATAVKVIEHTDGRPVQKVEQDLVQRIEYVLGEWEPPHRPPVQLPAQPLALPPGR